MHKVAKECGYLDDRGNFHKTLFKCNNENIHIEAEAVRTEMNNVIRRYAKDFEREFSAMKRPDVSSSSMIEDMFNAILYNHQWLMAMTSEIKRLENRNRELNYMVAKPRILRKDWWFGYGLVFKKVED
jgi:hypothetical protein